MYRMLENEHKGVAIDLADGRLADDGRGALALAADDREDLVPDATHGDRVEGARRLGSRWLDRGCRRHRCRVVRRVVFGGGILG
jgi:hypothetical protein